METERLGRGGAERRKCTGLTYEPFRNLGKEGTRQARNARKSRGASPKASTGLARPHRHGSETHVGCKSMGATGRQNMEDARASTDVQEVINRTPNRLRRTLRVQPAYPQPNKRVDDCSLILGRRTPSLTGQRSETKVSPRS